MTQPDPYTPATAFTPFNPSAFPGMGQELDVELLNLQTTIGEILANLELIQRDDGALANGIVNRDALNSAIAAGVNTPTTWATATDYTERDSVIYTDGKWYWAISGHTSGTFATDLANGLWELIFDFTTTFSNSMGTATPQAITASSGSAGVATLAARQDHVHPYTAPSSYALGLVPQSVQTSGFSPAAGNLYPVNIASSGTITFPAAPAQNDTIAIANYGAGVVTFNWNGLKYNGSTTSLATNAKGLAIFIYTNATTGWVDA